MDRSALVPGGAARLRVTGGPKAGSEFKLGPGETTVGRQADNTVVIPDISVSRHHVTLRREGKGYVLVDLGSGNGTVLNGERLEGEAPLQDGDVFMMGDTEVRFEQPRAAGTEIVPRGPPTQRLPVPRPGPATQEELAVPEDTTGLTELPGQKSKRRRLLLLAGGSAAVVIVLVAAVKLRQGLAPGPVSDLVGTDDIGRELVKLAALGNKALDTGDFRSAAASLAKAHEMAIAVGLDEEETKGLRRRAEFAKGLVSGQDAIEKAQAVAAQLKFAPALELLKPYTGEDHPLHDKAVAVIDQMKAKAGDKLAQGREALVAKKFADARQALEELRGLDPDLAEAKDLDGRIRDATAPTLTVTTVKPRRDDKPDPAEAALAAFKAGKLDEAIAAASAGGERAKALKASLVAFRDGCKDLDAEGAADRCLPLLKAIPGGDASPYIARLGAKGATAFLNDGIKAMGAENYSRAFQSFRKAAIFDPGNAVAEKHLRTIRSKAKELFEQAYVDKTPDADKARREFESVLSMTAPEDELHQKSKRQLKSLGGE
jgi:tetratricopeptide (TPR) repeat protein